MTMLTTSKADKDLTENEKAQLEAEIAAVEEYHDYLAVEARIAELTAKIPVGTVCDETNNCGGYLTAVEANELETLFEKQNRFKSGLPMDELWEYKENGSWEMKTKIGTYVVRRPSSNPRIWETWLLTEKELQPISGYCSYEEAIELAEQHWLQLVS